MADRRAIVVGASVAGLLTARVLADRVEAVTIVERDDLPEQPADRRGVPQGRHAHALLPSGEQVLRNLFPGMLEDLEEGGAQRITTTGVKWWQFGGYRVAAPGLTGTSCSRCFLENALRKRVLELPRVSLVNAAVQELAVESGRAKGVLVAADGQVEQLSADLVVDASGRGCQATRWLEAAGYRSPDVAQVTIDMAYATRVYRRTPGRLPDDTWTVTIADPDRNRRFGVAFPIEGRRWIVTLAGVHGDRPPTDDTNFLEFAETLPTGDVADVLRHEEPLTPIVTHRLPSNQWRHFEKLDRHLPGFLAIGDAICSFNPIYGQGMSSAALQALALGSSIDAVGIDSPSLAARFYRAAAKVIANPWAIAVGGDFSFPETTGPKPPMVDRINNYVKKAITAAQYDPVVAKAMWDVQGLLAPPPSLMKPPVMVRVLRTARKGPRGAPAKAVGV
ncbi:MAG: FAD-dependent monooxygenase [Acidimicrobiaceae bacterium]|nr:FAD-dependent monooxygenase [Acidimicrobiaceae bacterium]